MKWRTISWKWLKTWNIIYRDAMRSVVTLLEPNWNQFKDPPLLLPQVSAARSM